MNTPQPDISQVRRDIDAIDAALAELIVKRCNLSAQVAAAKRAKGDESFGWRPAREVEILRTLMRDQASLNPELAFHVWRALISANLAAQGPLTIVTTAAQLAQAKAAFSVGVSPQIRANYEEVFVTLTTDDHAIGILPWPDESDWWVTIMDTRFSALHVCAASPILGQSPQVLLVSARRPEPASEDIALIAGPVGASDGGVLARSNGLELVAQGAFVASDASLPNGCRLIGTFALV
jgi:chorismate mutase / prephenate dehydratase